MREVAPASEVYLWTGRIDMRLSYDRLSQHIREHQHRTLVGSGAIYVFMSRKRDRIKLVYWDGDGIAIWMKRLEAGVFRVELSAQGGEEILTGVDLKALLSGTDFSRIKLKKNAENGLYS